MAFENDYQKDFLEANRSHGTNDSSSRPANLADWISARILPLAGQMLTHQRLNALAFVTFALLVLGLFAASFVKPYYNWDMSAYFAAVMHDQDPTLSNEEVHERSWALIKSFTPADDYTNLTQVGEYRQHMIENADDFMSMQPMYEVKELFIAIARFLDPFIGLQKAFYLQSAFALLGVGLVLLFWMTRGNFLQSAPLVAGALLSVEYFKLGLYVTPDLPAAVFSIWGCERIMAKRPWTGVVLMLVAMGFRPDMLLFTFAFLLSAAIYRTYLLQAAAGFVGALALYLFMTAGSGHPGWWTHFYFSCVEIQNTLIGFHPDFSLAAYLKGVLRGVAIGLRDHDWWSILAFCLSGWALLVRYGKGPSRLGNQMMLACLLAIGGKFVSFPMPEDRFYTAILMVMVMVLMESWKPEFSPKRSDKAQA